ncbi:MAG: DUF4434 domain-containing protein [Cytophagaceae bacterium]|nr:DUF4434 domain-containing protein [Cytophagaceae bacterium]
MMNKILSLIFIGVGLYSHAASVKQLDNFSAGTFPYYYIAGLTGSTSNTQSFEGGSSLKIDYSLTASASGEVMYGHGTTTQDLSFNPVSLSIYVKGQAANYPQFKFMLYEDNDMDGNPFETGDDIFEFVSNTALSNTAWTQIDMPYASFTKFGGGSGTLDLNRIYAWRILLVNTSGAAINGTVYFDNLVQNTSYTPPVTGTATIKGAFLQLWGDNTCGFCGSWTQAQWEAQFDSMRKVCIDKVVIQYGVYTNVAWYSPSTLGGVTSYNTINNIFNAADNKGMRVYVGLFFDGEFSAASSANAATYTTLYNKNQTVINDIWTLFGTRSSFEGWYVPQEIHDLYWKTAADRNLLANWLQNVGNHAKSKSALKKIMIAPFYGPWAPADYVQTWYNNLLSVATTIDIVVPQDGCGTYANWGMGPPLNKDLDVDVPYYYAAIKAACDLNGVEFGADVESFSDPSPRVPASIGRLKSQIWEASRFTTEIYEFAWMYMQPGFTAASQQLYNDYKAYTSCNVLSLDLPDYNGTLREDNSLNVYTNTAGESFHIFIEDKIGFAPKKIMIADLSGKEIYQGDYTSENIRIASLPAGIYVMFIMNAHEARRFKLLKEY